MKSAFRRFIRIGKFSVNSLRNLCVVITALVICGIYQVATIPENRADLIAALQDFDEPPHWAEKTEEGKLSASYLQEEDSESILPRFIEVGRKRPAIRFCVDQLVYVRSAPGRDHYLEVLTKGNTVETVYGSLSKIEDQLPSNPYGFFITKGLILNLKYVDQIHCESQPPRGKSHFKLRVGDGCGASHEVRIRGHAIPKFEEKWWAFCGDRGWI